MMFLSPHFTLNELTRTSYTTIPNQPSKQDVLNLVQLCVFVLEPARQKLGMPIRVTSGYRCPKLNAAVGGVANSNHLFGRAADLHIFSNDYAKRLFAILEANPHIDELLLEHRGTTRWIHVAWSATPRHKIIPFYNAT